MKTELMEKFKWRMAKWLWAPLGEMPASDPAYAEWIKPQGRPVKNKRWHLQRAGRGNPAGGTKPIEEFFHRGSYSRHEVKARAPKKAVMKFRGKGSKVERRSNRSKVRREKGK
jgi:hypothetical protein